MFLFGKEIYGFRRQRSHHKNERGCRERHAVLHGRDLRQSLQPYGLGQRAKEAQERIAACIGDSPKEITFTSGGLRGGQPNHPLRRGAGGAEGKAAHHLHGPWTPCRPTHAEKAGGRGLRGGIASCGKAGNCHCPAGSGAIREDTALVTIMYANNEIASVLHISEIGTVCRRGAPCSTPTRYRWRATCPLT